MSRTIRILAILAALILIFGALQCAADCVSSECAPSPCHSPEHHSTICAHQTITAVLSKTPHVTPQAVGVVPISPQIEPVFSPVAPVIESPPAARDTSRTVLRI